MRASPLRAGPRILRGNFFADKSFVINETIGLFVGLNLGLNLGLSGYQKQKGKVQAFPSQFHSIKGVKLD